MNVDFCSQTVGAWKLIGEIIYMIRIAIPIIIVLLGTLDLGKAVIAGEDKKIKEAQKSFIRRLIYGVAIFFVFTIVKTIFGLLNVDIDKGDNKICWVCASKPHSRNCADYMEQSKSQSLMEIMILMIVILIIMIMIIMKIIKVITVITQEIVLLLMLMIQKV